MRFSSLISKLGGNWNRNVNNIYKFYNRFQSSHTNCVTPRSSTTVTSIIVCIFTVKLYFMLGKFAQIHLCFGDVYKHVFKNVKCTRRENITHTGKAIWVVIMTRVINFFCFEFQQQSKQNEVINTIVLSVKSKFLEIIYLALWLDYDVWPWSLVSSNFNNDLSRLYKPSLWLIVPVAANWDE